MVNISNKGVRFIAKFEGFESCPYQDVVGVWTIGYGHTEGVHAGSKCITRFQARRLMKRDCQAVIVQLLKASKLKLKQHELDALVSFGYNLGPGYFRKGYSMGNALHQGDRSAIAASFGLYVYAGGQKLEGLVRRRAAERKMFLG